MGLIKAANSLLSSLQQPKRTTIFASVKEAIISRIAMEHIPKLISENDHIPIINNINIKHNTLD
jgi:hypothetical protein